jgi:catechol 2,3-dioxygenase-like lactoylglutathione lyase family enzyme
MNADHAARPWALRSTLIAVSDLDRSVAFYREVGPFEEITREDAVAVLGEESTSSIMLILRESRGVHQTRHGQQSLGLRSITFNVGSLSELDRVEAVLRTHDIVPSRFEIADGASVILRGRDPDNQPLVFVCYDETKEHGADYYRAIANLFYTLDI